MENYMEEKDPKIKIGKFDAKLMNINGGNRFVLRFRNDLIPEYLRRMLSANHCISLADMYFVRYEEETEIFYEIDGFLQYSRFSELNQLDFARVLVVISNLLDGLMQCENYLLNSEKVPLEKDMFYINPATDAIKLLYIPAYEPPLSIRSSVFRLISDVFDDLSDNTTDIRMLASLKKHLFEADPGIKEMKKTIQEMSREISLRSGLTPFNNAAEMKEQKQPSYQIENKPEQISSTGVLSEIQKQGKLILSVFDGLCKKSNF